MLDVISYVNAKKAELKKQIESMEDKPRLAIITDERDFDANQSYIRSKTSLALDIGAACEVIILKPHEEFPDTSRFDGVIVQYPFRGMSFAEFRDYVSANVPILKDVDGLGYYALHKPCTPLGIYNYLKHLKKTGVLTKENTVVNIVGYGGLVGEPLAEMLMNDKDYTVCVTRSKTPADVAKAFEAAADVVVCATPTHNLIRYPDLHKVYVDCGCNLVDGKLLGNVAREGYSEEALITPVPGGVGRLTTLALYQTLVDATLS